jgi:GABA(A) receptor-associated protein
MTHSYHKNRDLETRKKESSRMKIKYPDRIPVIMEKLSSSTITSLPYYKFLVPNTITISELIYVLRKKIKLKPSEAIFFFIDNTLPSTSSTISLLYNEYQDPDGFLYITFTNENTFG